MQAPENTLHFGAVVGDLSGFVWVCRVCTLEEGTPPYHLEGSVPLSKFLPLLKEVGVGIVDGVQAPSGGWV